MIKVMIADDQELMRDSLQILLSSKDDIQIVALAKDGKEVLELIPAAMPDIILMDEPSIALDPRNRKNLIRILKEFPYLKIIASHDLDMIWDTCERTILLYGGEIMRDGDTKEILKDKRLLEECGLELPLRFEGRDRQ